MAEIGRQSAAMSRAGAGQHAHRLTASAEKLALNRLSSHVDPASQREETSQAKCIAVSYLIEYRYTTCQAAEPNVGYPMTNAGASMERSRETVTAEIADQIRKLVKALRHETAPVWAELELTMSQLKALVVMERHGQLSIGEFATCLGISEPSASVLADRLVCLGYVERTSDPQDRRRSLLELAPRGRELLAALGQGRTEALAKWLGQLDDTLLSRLNQGLNGLMCAIERPGRPADDTDAAASTSSASIERGHLRG
jgi:DNA-binding MarR family transcriptional regulator